ncbi:MAG: isocitrate lyase/phosphoenolpyruvate mutase family protein [Hyphomonadaceae bacterium]
MPARPQDAAVFHALHRDFLILPNAWDVASAHIVASAGAKAIATSSAAVAWSLGRADGHKLPFVDLVRVVDAIARVVALPITADAEGGYADDPSAVGENIAILIGAGAVGVNLEDGKGSHEAHLRKIEAARAAAKREGVDLYINARTDVFLKQLVPAENARAETLRRAAAIRDAGASGLFVPAVAKPDDIAAIASGVNLPLNVIARPGLPAAAELKALGVSASSAATGVFNAAMAAAQDVTAAFLASGDSDALWARRGTPPDYNALFA